MLGDFIGFISRDRHPNTIPLLRQCQRSLFPGERNGRERNKSVNKLTENVKIFALIVVYVYKCFDLNLKRLVEWVGWIM